jgi:GNAT superfamily N-acetyltransferase
MDYGKIKIENLNKHRDKIKEIASLFYEEWRYLYKDTTLGELEEKFIKRANSGDIPMALVAVQDNTFLGTVSLKSNDMDTREDLFPWLAGVYVKKEFRGQGVAKALIDALLSYARSIGFNKIYLYTPNAEAYYKKLGWKVLDQEWHKGMQVTIMYREI